LQTCQALVLGFLIAPFQHVHNGSGIHAHLYGVHQSVSDDRGPHLEDQDDDHASAWSLDTFTLVLTAGFTPFVLSRGPGLLNIPPQSFEAVVAVEERGHSPPASETSTPRAPPC